MPKFVGLLAEDVLFKDGDVKLTRKDKTRSKRFDVSAFDLKEGEFEIIDYDKNNKVGIAKIGDENVTIKGKNISRLMRIVGTDLRKGKIDKKLRVRIEKKERYKIPVLEDVWENTGEINEKDVELIGDELALLLSTRINEVDISERVPKRSPFKFYKRNSKIPKEIINVRGYNVLSESERILRHRKGDIGEAMLVCSDSSIVDVVGKDVSNLKLCKGFKFNEGKDGCITAQKITRAIVSKRVFNEKLRSVELINKNVIDVVDESKKLCSLSNLEKIREDLFVDFGDLPNSNFYDRREKVFINVENRFFRDFVANNTVDIPKEHRDNIRNLLLKEFDRRLNKNMINLSNYKDTVVLTLIEMAEDDKIYNGKPLPYKTKTRLLKYMSKIISDVPRSGLEELLD